METTASNIELWQPVLIAFLTALITGFLPAIYSARQTKRRIDAEAGQYDANAASQLAAAAAQLVKEQQELAQQKLEAMLAQQESRITQIEQTHKAKQAKAEKELLETRKKIALLIQYVSQVINAFGQLTMQMQENNIVPRVELPTLPEELELDL